VSTSVARSDVRLRSWMDFMRVVGL
jgi:hypothetical protein